METAVTPHAPHVARHYGTPVALCDVEDLHDADLDQVLADRLADGEDHGEVAAALARLVAQAGPAAVLVHDLGVRAVALASR